MDLVIEGLEDQLKCLGNTMEVVVDQIAHASKQIKEFTEDLRKLNERDAMLRAAILKLRRP